jgi:HEAT repeat protein
MTTHEGRRLEVPARALAAVFALVLANGEAWARSPAPIRGRPRVEGDGAGGPAPERSEVVPGGLLARTSLVDGRALLSEPARTDRLRGVERLAPLGSDAAVHALVESLGVGRPVARDPSARLAVVRALAPHASQRKVREALGRELATPSSRSGGDEATIQRVRATAALALAQSGDELAVSAVVRAALRRGPSAEAARAALRAAPPGDLRPVLFSLIEPSRDEPTPDASKRSGARAPEATRSARDEPSAAPARTQEGDEAATESEGEEPTAPKGAEGVTAIARPRTSELITLLGELGDARAIPVLREELERQRPATALDAAAALARLGDPATAAREAGRWIDGGPPRQTLLAAEALVAARAPDAARAVALALGQTSTRARAIALADALGDPALRKPLLDALPELEPHDGARVAMVLGRSGETAWLAERITDRTLGPAATTALARSTSPGMSDALRGGFAEKGERRRAWVRVGIARALSGREVPSELEGALEALASSADASDVETSALGRVALGLVPLREVVGAPPASGAIDALASARVVGAARGALARGTSELAPLARWLVAGARAHEPMSDAAVAAGVALLDPASGDALPRATLIAWVEANHPLAALAARSLARRLDADTLPRFEWLLVDAPPSVRIGAALGLGEAGPPRATAVLAGRLLVEDDPRVRAAIVRALAHRTEPLRSRAIADAARLDADPEVRAIAREAAAGRPLPELLPQEGAALFGVEIATRGARLPALAWITPTGLALPVVPADDGVLLLPGAPRGEGHLEVAARPEPGIR